MAEVADWVLNGDVCQYCLKVINDGNGDGYAVTCDECAKAGRTNDRPRAGKVHCPDCGKLVKSKGLKQHRRDAHGK